ncbi:hypothetical protein RB200_26340 [Streptomyces sp. PmtG]
MFEYELHQIRTAELAQRAARHGLLREARKALKAARAYGRDEALARTTAGRTRPEAQGTGGRTADRFTRAA